MNAVWFLQLLLSGILNFFIGLAILLVAEYRAAKREKFCRCADCIQKGRAEDPPSQNLYLQTID